MVGKNNYILCRSAPLKFRGVLQDNSEVKKVSVLSHIKNWSFEATLYVSMECETILSIGTSIHIIPLAIYKSM